MFTVLAKRHFEKIITLGYFLLPISLIFSRRLLFVVVILLIIGWSISPGKKISSPISLKIIAHYIPVFFPFIIAFLGFAIDVRNGWFLNGFKELETLLPVLIMPIIISLTMESNDVKLFKRSFLANLGVAMIVCLGYAIYNNIFFHDLMVHNWSFLETQDFYERYPIEIFNWGYFTYAQLLRPIGVDPVYFGFYLVIGIMLILNEISITDNRIIKFVGSLFLLFSTLFLLLVAAKTPLFILIICSVFLVVNVKFDVISLKRRIIALSFLMLLMVLIAITPGPRHRIVSVIRDITGASSQDMSQMGEYGGLHRIYLWSSSFNLIKQKPLLGYGLFGTEKALTEYYSSVDKPYFNSHSEYIKSLLVSGIIGLAILLYCLCYIQWSNIRQGNVEGFLFFCAIGILMLTENCFDRFFGTGLYACFAAILYPKIMDYNR